MGRQDVQQALRVMEADDSVRERLAAGDFAAVEGIDLSAEEQTLVKDAASDMPEVAGYAFDTFLKLDGIKGESQDDKHKDWIEIFSSKIGDVVAQVADRGGVRLEDDLTTVIAAGDTRRRSDPFDPARVLSDPEGSAALEALVGRLRAGGAELSRDSERSARRDGHRRRGRRASGRRRARRADRPGALRMRCVGHRRATGCV